MSAFPKHFLWGAATSAYQIEGSPLADGAGPSIWHRFVHTPGNVQGGDTGDTACDHYRLYRDDVKLMQALGVQAYRFSIAWARVLPSGRGKVNAKGLDFYARLVDTLLEHGIEPCATLYHWDLPAALDDRGGWVDRDIAGWFADYADVVFRSLDDRVKLWATLNEPWVVADAGYLIGAHAPGHRSLQQAPLAAHNLLRAHAAAVQAYRARGAHRIGIVVNLEPQYPASDDDADVAATERAQAYKNRHYLDPIFFGAYPEELAEIYGAGWPEFDDTDLARIREPIDFLGVNYYTRSVTRHDSAGVPTRAASVRQRRKRYSEMGWEVYPEGLSDILLWVKQRYGDIALYITENGAAFADPPLADDGELEDPQRVEYFREHLGATLEALGHGVDVRGYFAWSLLDNFEWGYGYSKRFGIVHVDFATQKRTPKASARFYAEVIASNGDVLNR